MFTINFVAMAMSYNLLIAILLLSLLMGIFSYVGFIKRAVYVWGISSSSQRADEVAYAIALGFMLGISMLLSLGMILPGLDYPR